MSDRKGDYMNNENLHKEIDLIQNCIKRMAQNSFIVKGWMLSLITLVLSFGTASKFNEKSLSIVVLIPLIAFWFLDSFYLQAEKKFRELYKWTIENRGKTNDFLYDLNPKRFDNRVPTIIKIMFSKTILPIYLSTILISFALFVF